jgi:hypothetical protein
MAPACSPRSTPGGRAPQQIPACRTTLGRMLLGRRPEADEAMREQRASPGHRRSRPPTPPPLLRPVASQPASRHPPSRRAVPRRLNALRRRRDRAETGRVARRGLHCHQPELREGNGGWRVPWLVVARCSRIASRAALARNDGRSVATCDVGGGVGAECGLGSVGCGIQSVTYVSRNPIGGRRVPDRPNGGGLGGVRHVPVQTCGRLAARGRPR